MIANVVAVTTGDVASMASVRLFGLGSDSSSGGGHDS